MTCVFCKILAGEAPARFAYTWPDAVAITPLNPVTPGHLLVIPRRHVADFAEDRDVSAGDGLTLPWTGQAQRT